MSTRECDRLNACALQYLKIQPSELCFRNNRGAVGKKSRRQGLDKGCSCVAKVHGRQDYRPIVVCVMTPVREVQNGQTKWHERVNSQIGKLNVQGESLTPGRSMIREQPRQ